MIPSGGNVTPPLTGGFLYPDSNVFNPLSDWEQGGINIQDPSKGLQYQNWNMTYDGINLLLSSDKNHTTPFIALANVQGITDFGFTFDINMDLYIAYVQNGVFNFYYYSTTTAGYTTMQINGAMNPRLTLDDKRATQAANADVLLFYMKNNQVCYRVERELFQTEHIWVNAAVNSILGRVGMNTNYCLQVEVFP